MIIATVPDKHSKLLGKISKAEFGTFPDRPFLMGLMLEFSFEGGSAGCGDGGKYTVNVSPECRWETENDRTNAINAEIERMRKILSDAKVNYVSELKGKPVEVTLRGNSYCGTFEDFRILTEVL